MAFLSARRGKATDGAGAYLSGYVKDIEGRHEVWEDRGELRSLANPDHLFDRAQRPAVTPRYPRVLHHLAQRDALLGVLDQQQHHLNRKPTMLHSNPVVLLS